MSFEAQRWSYSLRGIGHTRHAVLHALSWHHNGETGQCDPSKGQLADECSLSRRAVIDAVAELVEMGLISEAGRAGQASGYTLHIGATCEAASQVERRGTA